ncbi:GNAT family N-acetyltransferase [Demequina globuliformis]|uniref:GNAT family N-acetyltransferase n=1 Tax=Demequina globuliformis TaxID=676202 RepID=UPI00078207DD|nr:GNAT family N-acetyltransferase [Demequina globuliformis]
MDASLRWSALTVGDVEVWERLTTHLATVDRNDEFYSAADLKEELEAHDVDPTRDTFAVWAGSALVAYGQVWISESLDERGRARCVLGGGVHADWRGQGIGRELMDRMEARGTAAASERHPDAPAFFRSDPGRVGSTAESMLRARGYETVRYFNALARPLTRDDASLTVDVPAGVTLRRPTADDVAAVHTAHCSAFADHWGSLPPSAQTWLERWTAASSRPDVSTIAVGPHGEVLSYALSAEWVPRELYVNLVGTVPGSRGQGLGAAVLAATIQAGAESGGYEVIELDVDSESLTGATRLYDRLGFTLKYTTSTMYKDAPA